MENIGTLTWPTDRHSLAFPERCFRKVCKLASNNRYENLHHRVLTNAKNITWARKFKDVPFCSPLLLSLHPQVHSDPSGKMVLGCNTIKEPFNRNMLQKDQVANYHRKRKHLDACRGRNDRLMEDYEVFFYKQGSTDFWRDTNLLEFWRDDEESWIPPVWTWKTCILNSSICDGPKWWTWGVFISEGLHKTFGMKVSTSLITSTWRSALGWYPSQATKLDRW